MPALRVILFKSLQNLEVGNASTDSHTVQKSSINKSGTTVSIKR